ncbi:hypothetical protein Lesp02_06460 [Lentzea sp. NBRC 105346]|uniref:DUF3068 domain-containing protein n=1 Tax=Lentzea sp. NBRC 105346 TaxID=3032205 RepID=UPI0024A333FB|nr:DUF3068 domain-containing protein [Lentzea sp. NBRC 105346]GLZ28456.1 hypothetical protein Lesp02_06460 [Lentzea sp. NBRC 105346]
MRTAVVIVLLGLGAFAVAAGLVLQLHTYPTLAKVQHNINTVSVSQADGATALVYPPGSPMPEIRHNLNLTATTHVEGDLAQPEVKEGGDVTVWRRSTIVKEDRGGLVLSAEVRRICVNRHTGESVSPCHGQFYETEQDKRITATDNELLQPGLNFVFPFDTQQQDYLWYDTVLKQPLFVKYDAEDTVEGLAVYRFAQSVPSTMVTTYAVPGSLVGKPDVPSVDVGQYYSVNRTIWVEPRTGAVLKVREDVQNELRAAGQAEGHGTFVFDGVLQLNDSSVRANADQVKANLPQLFLITTLPRILWISGAVLIVAGLVLLALWRKGFVWAALALVLGAGLASGITVTATSMNNPDRELDLKHVVQSGGTETAVDYGVR